MPEHSVHNIPKPRKTASEILEVAIYLQKQVQDNHFRMEDLEKALNLVIFLNKEKK